MTTMRQRKQRQGHPCVLLSIKFSGKVSRLMSSMTDAERDSFVSKVLRDALKLKGVQ